MRAGMKSNWRILGDRQRDKVNVRLRQTRVMKKDWESCLLECQEKIEFKKGQ